MTDGTRGATPLLAVAWKVVGSIALLLVLFLGVGWLLPGTWEAQREAVLGAPPDSVFRLLDAPDGWDSWSPWPDVDLTRSGPTRGEGAATSWDDPWVGAGSFRIVESRPPGLLRYRVEVEGSMTVDGVFRLEAADGGTRVRWTETGDFGWNPLMGYAALTMDRVQGVELERGLVRLAAVAERGALPDSLRPGPRARTPRRPEADAPNG